MVDYMQRTLFGEKFDNKITDQNERAQWFLSSLHTKGNLPWYTLSCPLSFNCQTTQLTYQSDFASVCSFFSSQAGAYYMTMVTGKIET